MKTSELIQSRHLQRRAEIYIRQSSPSQVTNDLESQKIRVRFRDRAVSLGWHPNDINIIDDDLGRSGARRPMDASDFKNSSRKSPWGKLES